MERVEEQGLRAAVREIGGKKGDRAMLGAGRSGRARAIQPPFTFNERARSPFHARPANTPRTKIGNAAVFAPECPGAVLSPFSPPAREISSEATRAARDPRPPRPAMSWFTKLASRRRFLPDPEVLKR